MSSQRPNVLLIMLDQLGAAWLPIYGHPTVLAPSIDRLADDAVVFESAYCPSPLCAPSRAAVLTGRLPSEVEVYDNAAELRASVPTIAHELRALGYSTALVGKMHFVGPDQLHGFEHRLTTDVYPADLEWTPDWERPVEDPLPWYHTVEPLLTPGRCEASLQVDYDDEVEFRAIRHLRDLARRGPDTPFFLCASFTHPHDPWEVPPAYWERYDLETIEPARMPPQDDPHSRRLRAMCGLDGTTVGEEQARRARHGYYAAISYVDEKIGRLLATLRTVGLEDDTIVVLTADHGEMLGERGLWFKMSMHEPAARVPLILRAPGRFAPERIAEPVSLLDLVPTIMELAGAPPHAHLAGASLVGLLDGDGAAAPEAVVAEYLAEGVTQPMVMVRRGPYKFISCPGDPDLLYDVAADPDERRNLADSADMAAVVASFRAEVAERWDLPALRRRVLASQADRRRVLAALRRGTPPHWDHEPRFPASEQYIRTRGDMYAIQRGARLDAVDVDPAAEPSGA